MHKWFLTPHVADVSGVIVLTLSVCLSCSHSQTDRHTDLYVSIEVKWKDRRSSLKVKGIGQRTRSPGQNSFIVGITMDILHEL